jgi:hypothetical protein
VSYEIAEKEKCEFVGDGFIKCYGNFQDFKEGETYWLEYVGNDNYNVRSDNLLGKTYHITPCQLYTVFKKMTWLEKQGEQKPFDYENANIQQKDFAPKAEPKFKNGQWIVWQDKYYKVNYNGCGYELVDQNGLITSLEYGTIEENAHLWTIADAKDGDVLASELCDSIILFKGIKNNNIDFYCDYDFSKIDVPGDRFSINNGQHYGNVEDSKDFHPATKEQRDVLEKAMTDARYTFDFEKKELRKIECWNPKKGDTCQEKNTKRKIYLCDEKGIGFNYIEISNVHLAGGYVSIAQLLQDYELVEPTEEESAEITYAKEYDKPINERYLADFINGLSKQFPEVSFAKLSRIAVRVAKFVEQKMQQTK